MRVILAAVMCIGLSACAGDKERVAISTQQTAIGQTFAIQSTNAFIAPSLARPTVSNDVQTTGRAINDIGAYSRLKQAMPVLFTPTAGMAVDVMQTADYINSRVNQMISFEDDSASKETWRALPSGGNGDCDDYAVTKLYHMISSGVPRSAMRLTVATSKITGQWHLMLAVNVPGRGTVFMDNNNEHLLDAAEARDLYTLWFMENTATLKMELVA